MDETDWTELGRPHARPPKAKADPQTSARLDRLNSRLNAADSKEKALADGVALVERFVGDLGLSPSSAVACTAKELYTDLAHAKRGIRSDARSAAAAAAVYYGCKLERADRELRLVCAVCQVDKRAMHAATNEYKEALTSKPYYSRLFTALQAGSLIDMILDRLRLAPGLRKRVWRTAHALDEELVHVLDCGRKPRTLCSGMVYVALQREGVTCVGKKEVTEACGVCLQTLDKVVSQIALAGASHVT